MRIKSDNAEEYAKLIAHACRIGVELGADLIKTQYSGDPESFQTVVRAANGIPVVIAGGPLVERSLAIQRARRRSRLARLASASAATFISETISVSFSRT